MADTYSQLLRLRLQQTGANEDTWGALLNAAGLQLIEDAIAGMATITVAASDVTLSVANGANDQARMAILNLIGAPDGPRNIIVPALSKPYIVVNSTGQTMTMKTASGTGVAIPNGARQYLFCDGNEVYAVEAAAVGGSVALAEDANKLGGVDANKYARIDAFNHHEAGFAAAFVTLVDDTTITVNCKESNRFRVTLGGNRSLSLTDPTDGQTIEIWFKQDAGGNRTITWPVNVRFAVGSSPTLSSSAGAVDVYRLTYEESSNTWVALAMRNVSPASGATTFDVTLTHDACDLNLYHLLGSPAGIVTVNLTVPPGLRIYASNAATPALDLRGFDSGSTINLYTTGAYIDGHGGDGGDGARQLTYRGNPDNATMEKPGSSGRNGGPAIYGPGPARTLNIFNANGFIRGGGGGGGGGGAQRLGLGADAAGGGGGGGAGGGKGGRGGYIRGQLANNGSDGSSGVNGTFGSGGSGVASGGSAGTGGIGGDWGSAGGSGSGSNAGTGGAGGNAVIINGASVTFMSGGTAPNVKGAVS